MNPERRRFLETTVLCAFLSLVPASVRAFFEERFPVRTVEINDFRFDPATGKVIHTGTNNSTSFDLVVGGLVGKPLRIPYRDLRMSAKVRQVSDFHCVEGWSVHDVEWGGIRFSELLKEANPVKNGTYAVFHSLGTTQSKPGGQAWYIESFPVGELLDPERKCLLALDMDGKPLTHDHGAPLRVIAPYSLGYKSIKYVTRIEISRERKAGWWTLANPVYPVEAPVPASRLRKGK